MKTRQVQLLKSLLGKKGVFVKGVVIFMILSMSFSTAIAATVSYSGSTSFDNTFDRLEIYGLMGIEVPYDSQPFYVDTAGLYTLGSYEQSGDGMIFLYEDSFDPDCPVTNILTMNDDYTGVTNSRISDYQLETDTQYYFVTGEYQSGYTITFDSEITGPGTAFLEELSVGGEIIEDFSASIMAVNVALASNDEEIACNLDGIENNTADIATNAEGIATNTEGIATNATDIATNVDGIATNTTDIATNVDDITSNTTGITNNTTGITNNTTGITSNTTGITSNTTDIASNTTGIASSATGIATNAAGIASSATGIATNAAGIATNVTGIATNTTNIAGIFTSELSQLIYVSPETGDLHGLVVDGDSATITGGTMSTTIIVDDDGVRFVDSTNGETFRVENDGKTFVSNTLTVDGDVVVSGIVTMNGVATASVDDVAAEATARNDADNVLQNNIDAEVTARTNADVAEATARSDADNVLLSNLNAEATARINSDTAIRNDFESADRAMRNDIDDLDDRIDDVGAISAAFSAMTPSRDGSDTEFSIGLGLCEGSNALALGVFHHFSKKVVVNVGVSTSFDNTTAARAGITFGF